MCFVLLTLTDLLGYTYVLARTVSEEFSSSGDSKVEDEERRSTTRGMDRAEQNKEDGKIDLVLGVEPWIEYCLLHEWRGI